MGVSTWDRGASTLKKQSGGTRQRRFFNASLTASFDAASSETGSLWLDAGIRQSADSLLIEVCIMIEDRVTRVQVLAARRFAAPNAAAWVVSVVPMQATVQMHLPITIESIIFFY